MNRKQLVSEIKRKKSFLCIGLDTDVTKIPKHLLSEEDPIFAFNKEIIDATHDLAVAYKPNTAFYEAHGVKGWISLEKTINYINENYPEIFTIADAKRGDIGNTSKMYAKAFLEDLDFDSVTVAPYMGSDSVKPFLEFKNKWVILLGLTSNQGAFDFQFIKDSEGKELNQHVMEKASEWANDEQLMFVVGATKAEYLSEIRKTIPKHFLLVPGVGAQGGSLSDVVKFGKNEDVGLLINSSRGIIYADKTENFASTARMKASDIQREMEQYL
ncbi:MAG: orotidine-5'-phosphate decarboxylase [Bacteroidota bacterium]